VLDVQYAALEIGADEVGTPGYIFYFHMSLLPRMAQSSGPPLVLTLPEPMVLDEALSIARLELRGLQSSRGLIDIGCLASDDKLPYLR
jgi:hypothetical protein